MWGAERNNSIASFQLIEPAPGHRCESRSLALSCTWVERYVRFQNLEGFRHAGHQVRVPEVEADAHIVKMGCRG